MKLRSILFLAAISVAGFTATAQKKFEVKTSPDVSTNADTVVIGFAGIGDAVKSFQTTVTKLTGTVGGKVYFDGTVDGTWVRLDSLVNTNQAVNTKLFPITVTTYESYRFYYISTGTQTSTIRAAYIRRPDE